MKTITTLLIAALLAGCASTGANYRPLVDMQNQSPESYERNLAECQAYAAQRAGAAEHAVAGAVVGALLGVAFAAMAGGGIRNEMAGIGALAGATQAAGAGEGNQRDIIRRCLAYRGFAVLD